MSGDGVRVLRLAMIPAAVGCLLAAGCGGSSSSGGGSSASAPLQHPAMLVGDVGHDDAFKIGLTDDKGTPITHLAAGTYSLTINDESSIHDFHLTGSGVDKATTVPGTGKQTFSVTFTPGTYSFVCDPHQSQMHGKFTVS
jgi:hypothetical protein